MVYCGAVTYGTIQEITSGTYRLHIQPSPIPVDGSIVVCQSTGILDRTNRSNSAEPARETYLQGFPHLGNVNRQKSLTGAPHRHPPENADRRKPQIVQARHVINKRPCTARDRRTQYIYPLTACSSQGVRNAVALARRPEATPEARTAWRIVGSTEGTTR